MSELPALLDRKRLAAELGVGRATVDAIMRQVPTIHLPGHRKPLVKRADVAALLERWTYPAGGGRAVAAFPRGRRAGVPVDGKTRTEVAERIVYELERTGGLILAALCRAVGRGPKDATVRRALSDLIRAGRVRRGTDGVYRLA